MDYKKQIIEMLEKIDNIYWLRSIYNVIVSFKKQWGY